MSRAILAMLAGWALLGTGATAQGTDTTVEAGTSETTRDADDTPTDPALRHRKYGLIEADGGPVFGNGSIHGTGKTGNFSADVLGHILLPFGNGRRPDEPGTHAFQTDGDWVYFHQNSARQGGFSDGIVDGGLVNRFDMIQAAVFAQFDYVSVNALRPINTASGAKLGNVVVTLDYLFSGGTIGVFGVKGFKETGPIGNTPYYMKSEDQLGFHSGSAIGSRLQLDTSIAFKKRYLRGMANYPAATAKLSYLVNNDLGFFVEVDENPTFQNLRVGDRIVFGIQFGNWLRAKDTKKTQSVVPVSVPRPHYELLAK